MRLTKVEKRIVIVLIILAASLVFAFVRPKYLGPDELPEPEQVMLENSREIVVDGRKGPVTLEKLATYKVQAGVRGRQRYWFDTGGEISPMDLILAWGDLNQPGAVKDVNYRQSERWYYYTVDEKSPLTIEHVGRNSSNTHIIPADDDVWRTLRRVRENHYVELEGYLVNVRFESEISTRVWRTSLSRTDTGDGACEIFYVTRARVHR